MINNYQNIANDYRSLVGNKCISFDLSNIDDINLKKEIKHLSVGANILDIACGEGSDLAEIVNYSNTYDKKFQLFGSDISKSMLLQAKKKDILSKVKFKSLDYHDRYKTFNLTQWKNKFDLIFCSYAIYTYPNDLYCSSDYTFNDYLCEVFENIKQLLKPNGRLIINFRDFYNLRKKAKRERIIYFLTSNYNEYTDQTKVLKGNDSKVEYRWHIARSCHKNNKKHHASIYFYHGEEINSEAEFYYHEILVEDIRQICNSTNFEIVNANPIYFEENNFFSMTFKKREDKGT